MSPSDYQAPPELNQVYTYPEYPRKVEELRFSVRAKIMVDRHFFQTKPCVLKFLHHLHADHTALRDEMHLVENGASHEPEVAIDITKLQSKRDSRDPMVDATDDFPVQGITA